MKRPNKPTPELLLPLLPTPPELLLPLLFTPPEHRTPRFKPTLPHHKLVRPIAFCLDEGRLSKKTTFNRPNSLPRHYFTSVSKGHPQSTESKQQIGPSSR
eukprot:TRINITY_DN2881_c0_g1_i8.p1 TRINITY_DN2881_c0_g1~~TRINITY_DN2881_c0_g1_i8.p1  ORF type:complete len:100 (+),score=4.79 TRINITY_DN2881_c0_g1_i8:987-1286(+)